MTAIEVGDAVNERSNISSGLQTASYGPQGVARLNNDNPADREGIPGCTFDHCLNCWGLEIFSLAQKKLRACEDKPHQAHQKAGRNNATTPICQQRMATRQ
jgi:hypothetical protein